MLLQVLAGPRKNAAYIVSKRNMVKADVANAATINIVVLCLF